MDTGKNNILWKIDDALAQLAREVVGSPSQEVFRKRADVTLSHVVWCYGGDG